MDPLARKPRRPAAGDPLMPKAKPKRAAKPPDDPLLRADQRVKPPSAKTLGKYGLTAADWHRMCAACNHTCVVCGKPFDGRPLVIDHEHVKGFKARKKRKAKRGGHTIKVRVMSPADRRRYVRGVIHNYCNRFVRSWLTLPRAKAIVAYLEAFERARAEEPSSGEATEKRE